jgi:hypothetical protein
MSYESEVHDAKAKPRDPDAAESLRYAVQHECESKDIKQLMRYDRAYRI